MKSAKPFYRKMRGIQISRLMARDGLNCSICNAPLDRRIRDEDHPDMVTFDHVVPQSAGGGDEPSNLRLAHRRCNMERGDDPVAP